MWFAIKKRYSFQDLNINNETTTPSKLTKENGNICCENWYDGTKIKRIIIENKNISLKVIKLVSTSKATPKILTFFEFSTPMLSLYKRAACSFTQKNGLSKELTQISRLISRELR